MNDTLKLFFIKQSTPKEEKYTKNGVVHFVNVVVKNSPFTFQVGLLGLLNFHAIKLQTKLVYDGDEEKEVDFVKTKPLECKLNIPPTGEYAYMELRIHVLSSQHEDLFFRVKVTAIDPSTGKEFQPALFALSNPIKVISKPEPEKPKRKMNSVNDLLLETIKKMEAQQEEQQKKISKLFEMIQEQRQPPSQPQAPSPPQPAQQPSPPPHSPSPSPPQSPLPMQPSSVQFSPAPLTMPLPFSLSSFPLKSSANPVPLPSPHTAVPLTPSVPSSPDSQALKSSSQKVLPLSYSEPHSCPTPKSDEPDAFEQAFQSALLTFRQLNPEERPQKVRKLVRGFSREMTELFDLVAETVGKDSAMDRAQMLLKLSTSNDFVPNDELFNALEDFTNVVF